MTATTLTRTDVHRPSVVVTEDYEFAYAYDSAPGAGDSAYRLIALNDLLKQGYRFDRVHGGETCDHCGARLRYVAVLKHTPSMTLIKVGETCLDNRFSLATREFHALRQAGRLNAERQARVERIAKFHASHPDLAILTYPEAVEGDDFIRAIADAFRRNGDLTARQIETVRRALGREITRANERAERERTGTPAPSGRQTVTGEIVKVRNVESIYGMTVKMIVRDDSGFSCYGTMPSALASTVGDRVTFSANLTVSDRDTTFAFFARPTRARQIS